MTPAHSADDSVRGLHGLNAIASVAAEAWKDAMRTVPEHVVPGSCPVPWFGDTAALDRSPLRVLTAGLNPSGREFPVEDPHLRFPGVSLEEPLTISAACDAYFRGHPYVPWFSAFEPALIGMGASYYGGAPSTAVHTDLCTPVATTPTWAKLPGPVQEALVLRGRGLWHQLVRALRPDVLLISTAQQHIRALQLPFVGETLTIVDAQKEHQRVLWSGRWVGFDEHDVLVVTARAAQTPLGYLTAVEKQQAGQRVLETWRAGP